MNVGGVAMAHPGWVKVMVVPRTSFQLDRPRLASWVATPPVLDATVGEPMIWSTPGPPWIHLLPCVLFGNTAHAVIADVFRTRRYQTGPSQPVPPALSLV